MKRFSEQFKAKAETVKLRVAEKRDLRERLVSYMEYHPLPKGRAALTNTQLNDEFATLKVIRLNLWRTAQYFGAGIGIFLLMVTYLAERAVPGDALYAVKVGVNEELRSTMARTSYDKVVWETERMSRRIAEARLLASEGRLTVEVEEQVAEAVRTHSSNARKEIAELKQVDQEEATLANIKLAATLDVQAATLATEEAVLESSVITARSTTNLIASAISDAQASEVLATADELPSYDRLIARSEQEMVRAYELLSSVKSRMNKTEESDILRRLNDIERTIGEAMATRDTNDVLARESLVQALQRTQKLIVFMSNIDVRNTVAVEVIVPVVLTHDERLRTLKAEQSVVERQLSLISEALNATTTDGALAEKAQVAYQLASQAHSSSTSLIMVAEFDLGLAETLMGEAKLYAQEAMQILTLSLVPITEDAVVPVEAEVEKATSTTPVLPTDAATTTATSSVGVPTTTPASV